MVLSLHFLEIQGLLQDLLRLVRFFKYHFIMPFILKRHLVVTFSTNSEIRGPLKQMKNVYYVCVCLKILHVFWLEVLENNF